jgi:hypothetical protein
MVTRTYAPKSRVGRKLSVIPAPHDADCTPYSVSEEEFSQKTRELCSTEVSNALHSSHMVRVAKVIILGDMSVGKTSLVNRCVFS